MLTRALAMICVSLLFVGCDKQENRDVEKPAPIVENENETIIPERYRDLSDVDVEDAFIDAETFTFYTVDPVGPHSPDVEHDDSVEKVEGWAVLGKVEVTDKAERRRLLAAMQRGIEDSDGTVAKCFNPRHVIYIRAGESAGDIAAGDDSITYVVCFECHQVAVRYGTGERDSHPITTGPSPVFNEIARKHGLKIAE